MLEILIALAAAVSFGGTAAVVDGDTLWVDGSRVRLFGVDAPELKQRCGSGLIRVGCGEQAAAWLRTSVQGRRVDCVQVDRDRYGRIVARCRVGGTDMGAALVDAGWATAFRRYGTDYVRMEARAKAARRGLWALSFEQPEAYRRARAAALPPQHPLDPRCAVKGNVGLKDARIFHLPGSRDYQAVRIDPRRGERWFCSAAQATSAGWRPAR